MSFKQIYSLCVAFAAIMTIVLAPVLHDCLFMDSDNVEVTWVIRIIALLVMSLPITLSLTILPIWIAFFVAATNKAENELTSFIRNNL